MLTILDTKQNQRTFKSSLTLGKPACTSREFRNTISIVGDIMTLGQLIKLEICSALVSYWPWYDSSEYGELEKSEDYLCFDQRLSGFNSK